jgi:hypothetical protein
MFLFLLFTASSLILSLRCSLFSFLKCLLASRLILLDYPHLFHLDPVTTAISLVSFDLIILSIHRQTMAHASSSVHNNLDSPLWHFITNLFFIASCEPHAQPPSWRTTPCWLYATTYTLHIWRPSPPSATWGRAMPWWEGTHLTWVSNELHTFSAGTPHNWCTALDANLCKYPAWHFHTEKVMSSISWISNFFSPGLSTKS